MALQKTYIVASNAQIATSCTSGGGGYDGGNLIPTTTNVSVIGTQDTYFKNAYISSIKTSNLTVTNAYCGYITATDVRAYTSFEVGSKEEDDPMDDGKLIIHTFNVSDSVSKESGGMITFNLDKRLQGMYSSYSWRMYTVWSDDSADDFFVLSYYDNTTSTSTNKHSSFAFSRSGGITLQHNGDNTAPSLEIQQWAIWSTRTDSLGFSLGRKANPIKDIYLRTPVASESSNTVLPVGESLFVAVQVSSLTELSVGTIINTGSPVASGELALKVCEVNLRCNTSLGSGLYTASLDFSFYSWTQKPLSGRFVVLNSVTKVDNGNYVVCFVRKISD